MLISLTVTKNIRDQMVKIRFYLDEDAADEVEDMELDVESVPRPGEKITIPESEYQNFTVISVEHLVKDGKMITQVNLRRSAYL